MKHNRTLRVGSRDSTLAVIQSRLVMDALQAAYPDIRLELVTMKTTGDKILDRTLDQVGGKGLFVRELDDALRRRICQSPLSSGGKIPGMPWCCRRAPRSGMPGCPPAAPAPGGGSSCVSGFRR